MPERPEDREPRGEGLDPFWAAVRRRHPDIDLVLLPEERSPDGSAPDERAPDGAEGGPGGAEPGDSGGAAAEPSPVEDPETAAARCAEQAAQEWRRLVPGHALPEPEARWTSGPVAGTVRHETTLAATGVDPVATSATITDAAEGLTAAGWHVLVPPEGLPRVLAGREEPPGRRELQLVLVPAHARLVLRVRSGGVPVGAATARRLVTGGAA